MTSNSKVDIVMQSYLMPEIDNFNEGSCGDSAE